MSAIIAEVLVATSDILHILDRYQIKGRAGFRGGAVVDIVAAVVSAADHRLRAVGPLDVYQDAEIVLDVVCRDLSTVGEGTGDVVLRSGESVSGDIRHRDAGNTVMHVVIIGVTVVIGLISDYAVLEHHHRHLVVIRLLQVQGHVCGQGLARDGGVEADAGDGGICGLCLADRTFDH